jgi:trk system potassium uptake protein TrkA
MREGTGFVPKAETVLESGDEVLVVLDPEIEAELTKYLGLEEDAADRTPE